jgi:hypothetical protein
MAGHTDGMKIFRGIAALPMPDFKAWLKNGNHRKPITNYYRDMQTVTQEFIAGGQILTHPAPEEINA